MLRSHTLQGTVSVCWHKVPGVLSWSTPMATTTAVVNPPSCADGSTLRMLGHATACHLSLASGNVSTAVPTAGGGYILSQGGVYMFKCVCVSTRALKHQHVCFSPRRLVTHTLHRDLSHWCSRHGASNCSPYHHQPVEWQGRRLNICRTRGCACRAIITTSVAAVTTTIRRGNSVPSPPHRSRRGHCCNGGARGFRGCCHPTGSMR